MVSLIVFIIFSFLAAALGSVLTNRTLKTWYQTIKKPSWNPPSKVFAPVWTILYIMMAVAGWMVWERLPHKTFSWPMILFFIQLVLNALWSGIFFAILFLPYFLWVSFASFLNFTIWRLNR